MDSSLENGSKKHSIPYRYEPLEGHDTIRLLTIFPASSGESLSCNLTHHSLDSVPAYEAISYVWGDSTFTQALLCDGKSVSVTNSLHEVLTRLRHPDHTRTVWIDGVCIDQSNVSERGSQVQLMGKIYQNAQRVVIWLGPDTEHVAPIVFEKCLKISQSGIPWEAIIEDYKWAYTLNKLAECEWFERTWVLQELALAKSAWVMWGSGEIDWQHIQNAVDAFATNHTNRYINVGRALVKIETFIDIKKRYDLGSFEILRALRWTHGSHCTDARDKIYALLGLLPGSKYERTAALVGIVKADYSKSVRQVYIDFGMSVASLGLVGGLLRSVRHNDELECWTEDAPPSWVPDWTKIPRLGRAYDQFFTLFEHLGNFNRLMLCPDTKFLSSSSLHFGTVLHVSENIDINSSFSKPVMEFWAAHIKPNLNDEVPARENLNWNFAEALMEGSNMITGTFSPWITLPMLADVLGKLWKDHAEDEYVKNMLQSLKRSHDAIGNRVRETEGYQDYGKPVAWIAFPDGQRLFVIDRGHVGLGSAAMRAGDVVRLLPGTHMPVVLRRQDDFYRLVGGCYVARLMDLESQALVEMCQRMKMEDINIR